MQFKCDSHNRKTYFINDELTINFGSQVDCQFPKNPFNNKVKWIFRELITNTNYNMYF